MSEPVSQWDPFRGEVPFHRDAVAEPRGKSAQKPAFISWGMMIALGVMVLSGLGAAIGKLFYDPWLVPCAIALAASIVLLLAFAFGGDYFFGGGRDTGTWLLSETARANDWSFKKVARSVRSRLVEQEGVGPMDLESVSTGYTVQSHDPEIAPAFDRLPEVMEATPGRLIFPVVQGILRGRHQPPGAQPISFWLAAGLLDSNLTLAARELRTDSRGREHRHGLTLTALMAFDLGADTEIRAACLAKAPTRAEPGSLEGVFELSVRGGGGEAPARERFESLVEPEIRERLLDLENRLHAQMIVDGPTVFFTSYEVVAGNEGPRTALETMIAEFGALAALVRARAASQA